MKNPPPPRPARLTVASGTIAPETRPYGALEPRPRAAPDRPKPERIYINREWYIEVNPDGYIHGACFEGAFGCVIPLHEEPGGGRSRDRLALKIPRLMADTVRENEFIRHIVETEAHFVREANRDQNYNTGLVPIERLQFGLLRGIRELRGNPEDPRTRQDGNIILVSFPKDRPPRIVSLRLDAATGELQAFPSMARRDLGFVTRDLWERMRAPNPSSGVSQHLYSNEFEEPFFIEVHRQASARERPTQGPLRASMTEESDTIVWYSALPSIIYHWAHTTLQAVVCDGEGQRHWRLRDYYNLQLQIVRGIDSLHQRGLLHGDIRPANIMAMGEANDPLRFAVGDYGSFSVDPSRAGDAPVISGNTMSGASVSRQRTSLFYAPERRHGTERELADVALVLSDAELPDKPYLLCLGWREKLLGPGGSGMSEALRKDLLVLWDELIERSRTPQLDTLQSLDLPRPKDRLRIRDFVFEVVRCEARPGMMLFLCDPRFARVLHERIAAYAGRLDKIPSGTVISLPCYSEIHQWSAATDLYGVGALAVYMLFMRAAQADYRKRSGAEALDDSQNSKFETNLAELMRRLESVSLLSELWGDLDMFWRMSLRWDDRTEDPHRMKIPGSDITMLAFATKTVNNLLRTIHVRFLLQCFAEHMVAPRDGIVREPISDTVFIDTSSVIVKYNIAHFLYFIHYVLSCLHRRVHLRGAAGLNPENIICIDRCEPTARGADRASRTARDRLELLQSRLNSPLYRGFLVDQRVLELNYKPETEFQLLRQLAAHQDGVRRATESTLRFRSTKLWRRHLGLERYLDELVNTLTRVHPSAATSSPPIGALPPAK